LTLATTAAAVQTEELPAFDVASVKVAPPGRSGWLRRMDHGRYSYTNFNMAELLREAYGVKMYQISGPSWLGDLDHLYTIDATCPATTTVAEGRLMLRRLLAERFNLVLHREKRNLPVYSLVVAKDGLLLKPSKTKTLGGFPEGSSGAGLMRGVLNMRSVADMLARELDRPVLDDTGIEGLFDVSLDWVPESQLTALPPPSGDSIFQVLEARAGLKLVAQKAPIDLLVIDRIERIPTEN